jgi:hypothetical protein
LIVADGVTKSANISEQQLQLHKMKKLSRQRKWQIKQVANGFCMICGKPARTKYHCDFHAKAASIQALKRYYRLKEAATLKH